MTEENIEVKDRIWITCKSRIYAERRFRRYDVISHLALSMLSIIVIAITLLRDLLPAEVPLDAYTVVYSVFILAASIIVFGFKFGEIATLHRECYLRLQRLHDSNENASELLQQYHDILSSYPNHSDTDYESLVIGRTFPNKKNMHSPTGTPISWSFWMLVRWAIHHLLLVILPIAVVVASIGSIFWIW
ncbi:SLATT domain-containing protein [Phaeobacter sp. 11ANDIMAR09]|uniref:SLATT domain-containing protein n=1 Tax=Phaeobacter sp. 11ANDIMAR09 TaxID=1225647 RepID=UPI0009F9E1B1